MAHEHDPPLDPVFKSSLRELKWIIVIWLVHFVWVLGYCSTYGYLTPETPLITVIGMPSWVFWGVFVPWIAATLVSSWFALTQIEDHALPDASPLPEKSEADEKGGADHE